MFNWIVSVIETGGYAGIFFLMVLENVFPPIPSEIILPLAGFTAANGLLNVYGVIIAATLGSVVGALPWYYAGKFFTFQRLQTWSERFGRFMTVTPQELEYSDTWFKHHGYRAVLFGRLLPIVRTLISVPAGLARMPVAAFLFYSTLGTLFWSTLLIVSGFVLESQYEKVATIINPLTNGILFLMLVTYLYRVATYGKRKKTVK